MPSQRCGLKEASMSGVDIFFLLLVIIMLFVGFFKGMLKIGIAIGALYAAVVIAALYFRFLARNFGAETPVQFAQMFSFFLIFMISFLILYFAGSYSFKYVQFRGRIQYLDKFIGAFLGLVFGAMFASIFAMIFRYMFISQSNPTLLQYPMMSGLADSTKRSVLLNIFLNGILPLIYAPLSPILPDAADAIFQKLQ
jgi:uncharacterized membrane protein required for colicin V production